MIMDCLSVVSDNLPPNT